MLNDIQNCLWGLTKPGSGQELCVTCQDHEQVKDVPGIAKVGLGATAGNSPEYQLQGEESIETQLCKYARGSTLRRTVETAV